MNLALSITTEIIRNAAGTLDVLTSNLAADNPLRLEASQGAKKAVADLYSIADHIDALAAEIAGALKGDVTEHIRISNEHATEVAEARGQIEHLDRQNAELRAEATRLRAALETIEAWDVPLVESRGEAVSMSVAYGSSGVRDYFRGVARAALRGGGRDMKRCFNTAEAMEYLGVRRKFFTEHLAPLLEGKGVRAGTSIVYERTDLDAAWDRYKLVAGSERAIEGNSSWDVQSKAVSTRRKTGHMTLIAPTGGSAFESVVSGLTKRRKTTSSLKSSA